MQSAAQADLSFSVSAESADTAFAHVYCIKYPLTVFSIGTACRYTCARVIWKSSRYTLETNICQFLVNLQVKLTGTLGLLSETWQTVPSDSSVLIFTSTVVQNITLYFGKRCATSVLCVWYSEDHAILSFLGRKGSFGCKMQWMGWSLINLMKPLLLQLVNFPA